MYQFFTRQYNSMDDLRTHYRELAVQLHPDKNQGKAEFTAIFQAMLNEYHQILVDFIPGMNKKQQANKRPDFDFDSESEIARVLNELIRLEGLIIELCGSWLWVTGNTYKHKAIIRQLGLRWQNTKQSWYYAGYEFKPHRAKIMSMDHIRSRYGSMMFESEQSQKLAGA